MPTIPIYPPDNARLSNEAKPILPQILTTPSGLAIVEIQGTVKFSTPTFSQEDSHDESPSAVGKLTFPYYDKNKGPDDTSWHKRVHLYVGKHQRLTGEVKKLSKPIAVLQKRSNEDGLEELEIAEIVYYKLIFANRPEPVGGSGGDSVEQG